jgi:hypothetical protein
MGPRIHGAPLTKLSLGLPAGQLFLAAGKRSCETGAFFTGCCIPVEDLIPNNVQDQNRVPGPRSRADELLIMPEKNIQRSMISCIGITGVRRLAIFLIALATLSGYAMAHSPSDVTVSYDENSGDLTVAIAHLVDDPTTHYVKQVTVMQGATVLIDKSYTSQPDKSSFTYHYSLPELKGGVGEIKVNAVCNMIGSRSGTLMLTRTQVPGVSQATTGSQPPTASPTKAGALPVLALLAAGFVAMRAMR